MADNEYLEFCENPENHRLLLQEELILAATEVISEEMTRQKVMKKELAERLGKTKSYVSQMLSGERNMTLRTIADIAFVLNCSTEITFLPLQRNARILSFTRDQMTEWSQRPSTLEVSGLDDLAAAACGGRGS